MRSIVPASLKSTKTCFLVALPLLLTACIKSEPTDSAVSAGVICSNPSGTGFTSSTAVTFAFDKSHWCHSTPINATILPNQSSFVTHGAGIGAVADFNTAYTASFAAINAHAADFTIPYNSSVDTTSSALPVNGDGINEVIMVAGLEPTKGGLALTNCHFDTSKPELGYTDCDIQVFEKTVVSGAAITVNWSTTGTPTATEISLSRVLEHEFGHVAGFNDNGDIPDSIMTGVKFSQGPMGLGVDDSNALAFLYPP